MIPRVLVACLLALLPPSLHRRLGVLLLGWDAHPTAFVGHSIVAARSVVLGPRAAIGHLNVIKGIEELRLDEHAAIGFLNWISGPALGSIWYPNAPDRRPALILGRYASVLHRHVLDCSDTITFGAYATLGGWRSTVMTHGLDLYKNTTPVRPVSIGEHVCILSNCVVLTSIPARTILAAGSVAKGRLTKELVLYEGNPAVEVREFPADLAYFVRTGPPAG